MTDIENLVKIPSETDTNSKSKTKIQKNNRENAIIHPRALAKIEELTKRGILKPEKKK